MFLRSGNRFLVLAAVCFGFGFFPGIRAGVELSAISKPYTNIANAFGDSSGVQLSADGRWAAFSSSGTGLVTNRMEGANLLNVFLRDLQSGTTILVSRNESGAGGNDHSVISDFSDDGRYVLFESDASDLVPDDANEGSDVFLYDRVAETIEPVGMTADGDAGGAQMSRNGRFIVFESNSPTLAGRPASESFQVFLWDRESKEVALVSERFDGSGAQTSATESNAGQSEASVSEDGRYVAFLSHATDLVVPGPRAADGPQVYLRDMEAGTTLLVSRTQTRVGLERTSSPLISSNGMVVAFLATSTLNGVLPHIYGTVSNSLATAFRPTTPEVVVDSIGLSADGESLGYIRNGILYSYDLATGVTKAIQSAQGAAPGLGIATEFALSADGGKWVFTAILTNQTLSPFQLFAYDAEADRVALLSKMGSGDGANKDVLFPVISADGSTAGFTSYAINLADDDKRSTDVFVVPTTGTGVVQLVSVPHAGSVSEAANGPSDVPVNSLSRDGRLVAFSSFAAEIVPDDDNDTRDIFLQDLTTGSTVLVSSLDGVRPLPDGVVFLGMSRDGRYIAFSATNLPGGRTIYIFDAAQKTNSVGAILPDGSVAMTTDGGLSADGKKLAFRVSSGLQTGVYLRDLAAGTTVSAPAVSRLTFAGLSPGGTWLVSFPTGRSLQLNDPITGRALTLPGNATLSAQFTADDSAVLIYPSALTVGVYSFADGSTNLISTNAQFVVISEDGSTVAAQESPSTGVISLVVRDIRTGEATEVASSSGHPGFRLSAPPALSGDGRFLVFASRSALTGGTNEYFNNVFHYDRESGELTLVSRNVNGSYGSFASGDPSVSLDGRTVVFQSTADDLVPNDRNQASDVFLARLTATALELAATAGPAAGQVTISARVEIGTTYQLQTSADPVIGQWTDAGPPSVASSESWTTTVNAGGQAGYYRLKALP